MQKIKKITNIIFLMLSFVAVSVTYPGTAVSGDLLTRINARLAVSSTESLLAALIIILLLIFQYCFHMNPYQKQFWPYWLFGIVTSLLYVLTFSVYQSSADDTSGVVNLLVTGVAIVGFIYIFTNLAIFLNDLISKQLVKSWQVNYWLLFVLLLVIWTLQVFPLFPGMVSWDGYRQFLEFFHTHITSLDFTYYPTGHHPWASTLILGGLFSVGRAIGGPNVGLFTVVLVQMLVASFIYAQVVQVISKMWGKIAGIASFIFYASPFVAFWQVTIEKTPFFLAFTTWFVLSYAKILMADSLKNGEKSTYLQLTVAGIMMSLLRNDGVVIVFLSLLTLVIFQGIQSKKIARQLLVGAAAFLMVYLGWTKVALPTMKVVPGSTGEAISMPMRQLSAVVISSPHSLSKNDLSVIDKITPIQQMKNFYDVNNADNLKSLYPVDSFLRNPTEIKMIQDGQLKKEASSSIKKETREYLLLWFKQLLKHPKTYVAIFLAGNSQNLNPLIDPNPSSRGIMYGNGYMNSLEFLQPRWYHKVHYWTGEKTRKYITWPNTLFQLPIIRTILQPAFAVWVLLYSLAFLVFNKSKLTLITVPVILLASVALLSPINGLEKYMLPTIYVLPIILMMLAQVRRQDSIDS